MIFRRFRAKVGYKQSRHSENIFGRKVPPLSERVSAARAAEVGDAPGLHREELYDARTAFLYLHWRTLFF